MTVTSAISRDAFTGNGSVATYTTTWLAKDATEVIVYEEDATTGEDTLLTIGVDYSAVLNANGTISVTRTAGNLANGIKWVLERGIPYTQTVDLTQSAQYNAATMQRTVDRLAMEVIRLSGEVARCLKIPHLEAGGDAVTKLPDNAANRAGKGLAFDAEGDVYAGAPLSSATVSAFGQTLIDDANAAAARTTLGLDAFAALASAAARTVIANDTAAGAVPIARNIDDLTVLADGSTVRRDLSARAADVYNVKDWGTLGGADDSTAINAAIVAANAAGGGIVYVPKSALIVPGSGTSQIKPLSNVTLVFAPGCTITTTAPTAFSRPIEINTANASTIQNVTIEGNGLIITMDRSDADVQYCININCQTVGHVLDNIRIKDVFCKNSRYDGLTIGGNAGAFPTRIYLERVVCDNNYRNGASIIQVDGFYATDCQFKNTNGTSPQAGFDIEPDTGCYARNVNFLRCQFTGNAAQGLYVQRGTGDGTERGTITNCLFEANANDGLVINNASGYRVVGCTSRANTGGTTDGFNLDAVTDVVLSSCISDGNGGYGYKLNTAIDCHVLSSVGKNNGTGGILMAQAVGTLARCRVDGCTFDTNTGAGLALSGCSDVAVTNNSVIRNTAEGILLTADTHHCHVGGNHVVGNSTASDLGADGIAIESRSNYNTLTDNMVRKCLRFNRGTATAGGASTITLPATRVQVDDWYNGLTIRILSGTGSGQTALVSDYVGATGVITISAPWATPPDATSVYEFNYTGGNRHRYAFRIAAGCTDNYAINNDCLFGGGTGAFSDGGTGTVTTSANR